MRFLCHFWQKEIRGENLKFPHVQHAPSIPLLVPEERAMRRVFTMLGRFHLLLVDVWNIYSTSLTSIPQRLRGTAQGTFIWKNEAMESRTTYLYTGQPPKNVITRLGRLLFVMMMRIVMHGIGDHLWT